MQPVKEYSQRAQPHDYPYHALAFLKMPIKNRLPLDSLISLTGNIGKKSRGLSHK
ncbi:hypothetical protein F1514_011385 [Yersinia pestis]|nr:hypothetical protein [Yersinia pestis]